MQVAAPSASLNVPAGQSVAEVLPVPLAYEPTGAGVQGVDPVALKVPAGQDVGTTPPTTFIVYALLTVMLSASVA